MATPGKLTVNTASGHVTGPAALSYNDPFPTRNGSYGSGAMMGVVMHTMVGDLPGTASWFNNPQSQASAHFGIAQSGEIWQFGPVGKGWIAWAQAEGNEAWYSVEHADDGNPANPLTSEQVTASAQLLECLSAFAGFPLQVSNSVTEKGYGWHGMGGAAWGGHPNCPGNVRKAQRTEIVALAAQIRSPAKAAAKPATAPAVTQVITSGIATLASIAATYRTTPAAILGLTAEHAAGAWSAAMTAWLDDVFAGTSHAQEPLPKGITLQLPKS
jgi:energy-converting hydrogenase Eha subunit A